MLRSAVAGRSPLPPSVIHLSIAPAAGPVKLVPHDIDAAFRGGYAVAAADFNKDGKIDVIANSLQVSEVAWYENPSWTRHVIVPDTRQIVNQAMADIDGDGIPEIAFQSAFAMQPANSAGLNWLARHDGDPRQPWKVEKIDGVPDLAPRRVGGPRRRRQAGIAERAAARAERPRADLRPGQSDRCSGTARRTGRATSPPKASPESSTACGPRNGTATSAISFSSRASKASRCIGRRARARR